MTNYKEFKDKITILEFDFELYKDLIDQTESDILKLIEDYEKEQENNICS